MTLTETLLILAHLADPASYAGYGWQIEEQLDSRARAVAARDGADSDEAWREAQAALIAAESRLARLLDVEPPPRAAITFDDGLGQLGLPDAEQLTCEPIA